MDRSSKTIYLLVLAFVLGVIGIRVLPRIIGSIISVGFFSPLYFLCAVMGILGVFVLGFRWYMKR
jgi:hypothetical protein